MKKALLRIDLREIKKSRLLEDESFTYMISSDERTNNLGLDAVNLTNFYDIKFELMHMLFFWHMLLLLISPLIEN